MEHIEMVEKLMSKANVSYAEAKQALENNNWDMLDALIDLERQGKVRTGQGAAHYTTEPEKEQQKTREEKQDTRSGWDEFWSGFCGLIRRGMQNSFVAQRRGETIISIPVLLLIVLLCVGFWIILPLMIVGLFCECRYSFQILGAWLLTMRWGRLLNMQMISKTVSKTDWTNKKSASKHVAHYREENRWQRSLW